MKGSLLDWRGNEICNENLISVSFLSTYLLATFAKLFKFYNVSLWLVKNETRRISLPMLQVIWY